MITIKTINEENKADINIPNEPFRIFGRVVPSYAKGVWSYDVKRFDDGDVHDMCFPDENYDFDKMKNDGFLFVGAYDGEKCVGLAALQKGFFKYMYLSDLKVLSAYRGKHVGKMLVEKSRELAKENGFRGLYTIGQDNNVSACLFYLGTGFRIGGLDTDVYKHTKQEGKADIIFYSECD